MTDDPFRCICPLDPTDLVNGYPRAVKGCPAHRARYAAQQAALAEARMSDDITPAELADYDQIHAETLSYLDAIIRAMRDALAEDKPRPLVVAAMAAQFAHPHANTVAAARFTPSDIANLLAVAVDRLEPGWDA